MKLKFKRFNGETDVHAGRTDAKIVHMGAGTGSAGALVALLDETDEHVLAFSACALTSHAMKDLTWQIDTDADTGLWPGKEFEVCSCLTDKLP